MTTNEHIELLQDIHRAFTKIYDAEVPEGGDLWQASPRAQRIREAIRSLRASTPVTLGDLDAANGEPVRSTNA